MCTHEPLYFTSCCQQQICDKCYCCENATRYTCQRCPIQINLVKCKICNWILCSLCDETIHTDKFKSHERASLYNSNDEITKQMQQMHLLDEYCAQTQQALENHFHDIQVNVNEARERMLKQIQIYQAKELDQMNQRIVQIKSSSHIKHQPYQEHQFLLPNSEPVKLMLNQQDYVKAQPISPRRPSTPAKRSQSMKKIEVLEEFCQALDKRKFTSFQSQHNSIQLKWNNCLQKVQYQLEIGIGMRVQGVEQFKCIYVGENPIFQAKDLQPKTTYRFRIQAIQGDKKSEFSDTLSVQTLYLPSIEDSQLIQRKFVSSSEIHTLFERPGVVLGTNQICFGIVSWEVKIIINGSVEDLTASLVIGVANKQRKMVGCTINYGYQRESLIVKVFVNMDEKFMIVTSKINPQGEKYSLSGPMYPAFQNKNAHKGSGCKLQLTF